jgi:hypothetical protein
MALALAFESKGYAKGDHRQSNKEASGKSWVENGGATFPPQKILSMQFVRS